MTSSLLVTFGPSTATGASFTAATDTSWVSIVLVSAPSSSTWKVTVRDSVDGLSDVLR